MFKYMILFACIAYATARPGNLIATAAGPTLYSALPSGPLSSLPLSYAAGPIALSGNYYNPLAYAAPYPYPSAYTAYNFKAPIAYSALPAGATIIH